MFDPCLGMSTLSSAEAESEGADMVRAEAAIVPGAARALVLAGRMGRLAAAGIVSCLTKERERERERRGGRVVWVEHSRGRFLIMQHH